MAQGERRPYLSDVAPSKPPAMRAWNRTLVSERFDPAVGDGFLLSNFGTRGEAPERTIAGYPEDALRLVE